MILNTNASKLIKKLIQNYPNMLIVGCSQMHPQTNLFKTKFISLN